MLNSEKLALIRRVLDAPATFDTDDAVCAISDIVIDGIDPFDDDYWSDVCGCCGDRFASVAEAIAHERTCCAAAREAQP